MPHKKSYEVPDLVGHSKGEFFEGEYFPQHLEAYNSPGFGVGSTKFTEAMGTGQ